MGREDRIKSIRYIPNKANKCKHYHVFFKKIVKLFNKKINTYLCVLSEEEIFPVVFTMSLRAPLTMEFFETLAIAYCTLHN